MIAKRQRITYSFGQIKIWQRKHSGPLVARQLKDASLYEKNRLAIRPTLSDSARVDIAEIHLENGNAKTALSWLESAGHDYRIDRLLLNIHKNLGNQDKAAEMAWLAFRRHRDQGGLATLLSIIGEDRCDEVITSESRTLLDSKHFSEHDAEFLADVGRMNEAETYVLNHANQLDGGSYVTLGSIAKAFEQDRRWLVASVAYRALLDSILARGYSRAYHHGVDYLRALDRLAENIIDWKQFEDHVSYKSTLRRAHSRKSAFWPQYDKGLKS